MPSTIQCLHSKSNVFPESVKNFCISEELGNKAWWKQWDCRIDYGFTLIPHTHTAALDRIVYVQKFRTDLATEYLYNVGSKMLPERFSSAQFY